MRTSFIKMELFIRKMISKIGLCENLYSQEIEDKMRDEYKENARNDSVVGIEGTK